VWFEEQVNLPISPLHTPQQVDYAVEQVAALVAELREAGARARLRKTAPGRGAGRRGRPSAGKKARSKR
jgi:hypothetical protein